MKLGNRNKKRYTSLVERFDTMEKGRKRLVFALSTLPTVLNLLIYALLIKELRVFLLICAGVLAAYFALVFFFEIKDGEWSVFALAGNALVSLLVSVFFPLAYKIYLWFIVIAIELAGVILIYIFRERIAEKLGK
ncbi:MAG: hypothetical protein IJD79_07560 [Clostridia bacterium]|nr:hypothetical protein [Clostridia bacterium]